MTLWSESLLIIFTLLFKIHADDFNCRSSLKSFDIHPIECCIYPVYIDNLDDVSRKCSDLCQILPNPPFYCLRNCLISESGVIVRGKLNPSAIVNHFYDGKYEDPKKLTDDWMKVVTDASKTCNKKIKRRDKIRDQDYIHFYNKLVECVRKENFINCVSAEKNEACDKMKEIVIKCDASSYSYLHEFFFEDFYYRRNGSKERITTTRTTTLPTTIYSATKEETIAMTTVKVNDDSKNDQKSTINPINNGNDQKLPNNDNKVPNSDKNNPTIPINNQNEQNSPTKDPKIPENSQNDAKNAVSTVHPLNEPKTNENKQNSKQKSDITLKPTENNKNEPKNNQNQANNGNQSINNNQNTSKAPKPAENDQNLPKNNENKSNESNQNITIIIDPSATTNQSKNHDNHKNNTINYDKNHLTTKIDQNPIIQSTFMLTTAENNQNLPITLPTTPKIVENLNNQATTILTTQKNSNIEPKTNIFVFTTPKIQIPTFATQKITENPIVEVTTQNSNNQPTTTVNNPENKMQNRPTRYSRVTHGL